ncbi:hypothetical protein CH303_26760 [Rhodococcoides fascians]|nr:hypothetical protein CH303_26760 [Rhodococcus fascians]
MLDDHRRQNDTGSSPTAPSDMELFHATRDRPTDRRCGRDVDIDDKGAPPDGAVGGTPIATVR